MRGRRIQGLYIISVAAQILDLHPQTLRKYERAGFVEPPRMGTLRLYSEEDIVLLRQIKYLVEDLGLNLAGVQVALTLSKRLEGLRNAIAHGDPEAPAKREQWLATLDHMLEGLGIAPAKTGGGEPEQEGPRPAPAFGYSRPATSSPIPR